MTLLEFMKILFLENKDGIKAVIKNGYVSDYFNLDVFDQSKESKVQMLLANKKLRIGIALYGTKVLGRPNIGQPLGLGYSESVPQLAITINIVPNLSKMATINVNVWDHSNPNNSLVFDIDLDRIDESYACLVCPILRRQVLDDIDIDFFRKNIRR